MLRLLLLLAAAGLCACSREARPTGPTPQQTAPAGDDDPRISAFQDNAYQVAQGSRYFSWYGCAGCHAEGSRGVFALSDGRWRRGGGFAAVYRSIATRHGRLDYGKRIPIEQMWQLTAFVRDLPEHHPEKRLRLALDQQAEPVGAYWSGPQ